MNRLNRLEHVESNQIPLGYSTYVSCEQSMKRLVNFWLSRLYVSSGYSGSIFFLMVKRQGTNKEDGHLLKSLFEPNLT